ncbi:MAG: AAA family ATPase [Myxococcota bacterium]
MAVFIIWSRLGSPLTDTIRKPDGGEYRSGTECEFDTMEAAWRASGGTRPQTLCYVRNDEVAFTRRLLGASEDDARVIRQQMQLARSFIDEKSRDERGRNLRAFIPYERPVDFALLLRFHLRDVLDRLLVDLDPSQARWMESPYRGLEVFDVEHAEIFFGRQKETRELEEALRQRERAGEGAFVCVVGASGSGKSSLVRAGLAATLRDYNLDEEVSAWRLAIALPRYSDEGDFTRGLASRIWRELPELHEVTSARAFGEALAEHPTEAMAVLRTALDRLSESAKLLVVVDQLEEVFSDNRTTPAKREMFWRALAALAKCGRAWVVATLRSDFYASAQLDAGFLALKGKSGHFDLVAPSGEALESLIAEPALLAGLRFDKRSDESLRARILEEAIQEPDALPLVEYLLHQLYERRTAERVLTFEAHDALGGVSGAIGRRAEAVLSGLPTEVQATLPRVLRRLVMVEADGRIAARPSPQSSFSPGSADERLVTSLVAARLLVAEGDGRSARVRVTHEALLTRWDRARQELDTVRERLAARQRLEEAHALWLSHQQSADLLLSEGRRLLEAEDLIRAWGSEVSAYADFVANSRAAATQRRRRTRLIWGAVLAVLAVGGFAFVLVQAEMRARAERTLADSLLSQGRRLLEAREPAKARALVEEAVRLLDAPRDDAKLLLSQARAGPGTTTLLLEGHLVGISAAAASAEGSHYATGGQDGSLVVWSADGRQLMSRGAPGRQRVESEVYQRAKREVDREVRRLEGKETYDYLDPFLFPRAEPPGFAQAHGVEADGAVDLLAFSPDGNRMLVGWSNQALELWGLNGEKTPTQIGRTRVAHHSLAAIAPIGNVYAVVGRTNEGTEADWPFRLTLYSTASNEALTSRAVAPTEPVALSWSRDGAFLAVALPDEVQVWSVHDSELEVTRRLPSPFPQGEALEHVAFGPDGALALASQTRAAVFGRAGTGAAQPLELHSNSVEGQLRAFTWLGETNTLAAVGTWGLSVVTPGQHATLRDEFLPGACERGGMRCLAASPKGDQLAVADGRGTVRVVDLRAEATLPLVLEGHLRGELTSLQFIERRGDVQVFTASVDGSARVWRTWAPAPRAVAQLGHRFAAMDPHSGGLAFVAGSTLAFVAPGRDELIAGPSLEDASDWRAVAWWDDQIVGLSNRELVFWSPNAGSVRRVALESYQNLAAAPEAPLLAWDTSGRYALIPAERAAEREPRNGMFAGAPPRSVCWLDARRLLVEKPTSGSESSLTLYDGATMAAQARWTQTGRGALAVSPGSHFVVLPSKVDSNNEAAADVPSVSLLNWKSNKTILLRDSAAVGRGARVGPPDAYVLTWGDTGALLWSIQEGRDLTARKAVFFDASQVIDARALTTDASLVLSVSADGFLRVWSGITGENIFQRWMGSPHELLGCHENRCVLRGPESVVIETLPDWRGAEAPPQFAWTVTDGKLLPLTEESYQWGERLRKRREEIEAALNAELLRRQADDHFRTLAALAVLALLFPVLWLERRLRTRD